MDTAHQIDQNLKHPSLPIGQSEYIVRWWHNSTDGCRLGL